MEERGEDAAKPSGLELKSLEEKSGAFTKRAVVSGSRSSVTHESRSERDRTARDTMATCAHSLDKRFKRFQRPVSHAGASGFELVNPAGRWASVSSSRVRPSQRENSERLAWLNL